MDVKQNYLQGQNLISGVLLRWAMISSLKGWKPKNWGNASACVWWVITVGNQTGELNATPKEEMNRLSGQGQEEALVSWFYPEEFAIN